MDNQVTMAQAREAFEFLHYKHCAAVDAIPACEAAAAQAEAKADMARADARELGNEGLPELGDRLAGSYTILEYIASGDGEVDTSISQYVMEADAKVKSTAAADVARDALARAKGEGYRTYQEAQALADMIAQAKLTGGGWARNSPGGERILRVLADAQRFRQDNE